MSDPDGSATSVRFAHPQWFAFKVRPRHEKVVALQLAEKGQHCFLPLVRQNRYWAKRLHDSRSPPYSRICVLPDARLGCTPDCRNARSNDVVRDGFSPALACRRSGSHHASN